MRKSQPRFSDQSTTIKMSHSTSQPRFEQHILNKNFSKIKQSSYYQQEKNQQQNHSHSIKQKLIKKQIHFKPQSQEYTIISLPQSYSNSLCKSTINFTNGNYSIQSEPNQIEINFRKYFCQQNREQYPKVYTKNQIYGTKSIYYFLEEFDRFKFIKKLIFHQINKVAQTNKKLYQQSLNQRQYHYIEFVEKGKQLRDIKYYEDIRLLYLNKLVGVLNPNIISQKKEEMFLSNVEKYQHFRESEMKIKYEDEEQPFKFNFQIHRDRFPQKSFENSRILRNY